MTESQFWTLIEETHKEAEGNSDGQALLVEDKLMEMEAKEAEDFTRHLQDFLAKSYNANLWSASYLINGDASDETFEHFRAWAIAQGKEKFELILENPDAIIDMFDPDDIDEHFQLICPGLLFAGFSAWEEITGSDPVEMPFEPKEVDLVGEYDPDSWDDEYLEMEFPLLYEVLG